MGPMCIASQYGRRAEPVRDSLTAHYLAPIPLGMEHPARNRWAVWIPLLLGVLLGLVAIKFGIDGVQPAY